MHLGFINSSLRSTAKQMVDEGLQRICEHPFVIEARDRTLSRSKLERWIKCAGRESRLFPDVLENMRMHCTNHRVREILADNLDDEYGNGNPERAHFRLYLQLLDELMIPREYFYEYQERAGIKLACELAENISLQPNLAIAIGYMLINEGIPKIAFAAVQHALLGYYPTLQTDFFKLHIETDEKHITDLYAAVNELDADQETDLLFGISVGERASAVLLDEAYGLFDFCVTQ
jgi:pyrroloquinoline quinone (PQQ) biosynthesis protein C